VLSPKQDAYGRLIYDYYRGADATEIVERDDGWIATSGGPRHYFASFREWPKHHRLAMRFVRGHVLDIGCGAGRVSLYAQRKGHPVLAVDNSPLAIRTVRLRGVRQARVLSITRLNRSLGTFDTLVLLGNNFGLLASLPRAHWLLARFARMTRPSARIVAEVLDPYDTTRPEHFRYHRWNRARGRMAGQSRIRVRYLDLATPWFDYLFVSRNELRALLRGSEWRVEAFIDSDGPTYIAVLSKTRA
jgi:SAM-dependent methyltransferase